MIQQGIVVGETFGRKQLFLIKRNVSLSVLGMSFMRDFSQGIIMGHAFEFEG